MDPTDDELARLWALCADPAASPRPWRCGGMAPNDSRDGEIESATGGWVALMSLGYEPGNAADARLVVAAVNALPELLEALVAARARIRELGG